MVTNVIGELIGLLYVGTIVVYVCYKIVETGGERAAERWREDNPCECPEEDVMEPEQTPTTTPREPRFTSGKEKDDWLEAYATANADVPLHEFVKAARTAGLKPNYYIAGKHQEE